MMGSRRALAYLVLVFLLGLAAGVLGTLWAGRSGWFETVWGRGASSTHGAFEWLTGELDLTPEQQKQLELILDETAAGYHAIRERTRPQYEQVRQAGRQKIRAILTAAQQVKFEELVRRVDEERERRRRGHGKHRRPEGSGGEKK